MISRGSIFLVDFYFWFCYGSEVNRNGIILLVAGLLIGVLVAYFIFIGSRDGSQTATSTTSVKSAAVTGTFNINGVVPSGATITLLQRDPAGKGKYIVIAQGLSAQDKASWDFSQAVSGKSYEIKAQMVQDGKTIAESDPIFVSAPATDEAITLDIESASGVANATIAGTVGVNGYIPTGATITIEGKGIDTASQYETIVSKLAAKDGQYISYTTAVAGKTYNVRGTLYDANGNKIGESNVIQITAPAENETLDINSTAKAPVVVKPTTPQATAVPVANAVISGTINFNGAAPANSRIVIFQRPTGATNTYQVAVNNVTAANGTSWQWTGAQASTWYDIIAILKQQQSNGTDKDIATSNTITLTAPATNEVFTINSGFSLSAPNGSISVTCGNNSNNTFNATVYFQSAPSAQSYWYQIGTSNGGAELSNSAGNTNNNPMQQINVTMNSGTTYYARYAYATTPNQAIGSSQYSGFSGTTQIRCQ